MSREDALRLLTAAYDGGIRHFDTAPLYGWGVAEELFGAFAASKTDLTIVTKAGIAPPSRTARLLAKAPGMPEARPAFGQFRPGQVTDSLEASLKRLRVEQVGALLLHEAPPDAINDALITETAQLKRDGKTAALGLATSAAHTAEILERYPSAFDIVQIPIDGLTMLRAHSGPTILHSVLGPRLRTIAAAFATAPEQAEELGVTAGDTGAIAQVLLRAALAESRDGVVLFSSTRPQTILANAQLTPLASDLLARFQSRLAAPQTAKN